MSTTSVSSAHEHGAEAFALGQQLGDNPHLARRLLSDSPSHAELDWEEGYRAAEAAAGLGDARKRSDRQAMVWTIVVAIGSTALIAGLAMFQLHLGRGG